MSFAHLTERVGTVVADESTPSFSSLLVALRPGKLARPGELLVAVGEEGVSLSVGRVVWGREVNPYEAAELSHMRELLRLESPSVREDLPRRFRLVMLDLLEELVRQGDSWNLREPQTLVPAGSPVYRATPDTVAHVLGLVSPSKGLSVGTLVGGANLPISLNPKEVLPRHILIVGTTGTGKSWLRGVLAEELVSLGVPQVNLDIHGEAVEATEELNGINLTPGKTLTIRLSSLAEPEVIGMIPWLTELQEQLVRRAFLNLKKRGDFDVDDLVNEIPKVGAEFNARRDTISIASDRASALRHVHVIGKGVDWPSLLRPKALVNIDCRGLGHSELHAVAAAIARELLSLRMRNRIPPLVLSIDEAHMFLPSSGDTPSSTVLRETIRFGRHYGVCLILVTPSPTDIDQRVIRVTNTRFIFALEPDQLDSLRGVFADAPRDLVGRLPKFEQGTCLLTGSRETVRHAVPIRVRGRETKHGGATPDIVTEVQKWKPRTQPTPREAGEPKEEIAGPPRGESEGLEKWL